MALIDANALKIAISNGEQCRYCEFGKVFGCGDCGRYVDDNIEKLIDDQPEVKPEPVKHAHWIVHDEVVAGMYHEISECSECGMTTDRLPRECMPFCYGCGAMMDE